MNIEKKITSDVLTLTVEIDKITFNEIILLSKKNFDEEVKTAVVRLKLKIENYKKAQDLNLTELLSN